MSIKIGDMLIKAGLITTAQLEEGLKQQVIYGGKLGTNLIELGYIDEEALAFFLSQKLGIPYVHPSQFENIPKEVIAAIPRNIVEKEKVFPMEKKGHRLVLAMPDPLNMTLIDDLSFRLDVTIKPVLAPEIRLVMAMEKYYDIPRDMRYISMIDKFELDSPSPQQAKNLTELKAVTAKDVVDVEEIEFLTLDEEISPDELAISATKMQKEMSKKYTIDDISHDMVETANRDDIAQFVINYINQHFPIAAIFLVWDKFVMGWKASGPPSFVGSLSNMKLPLGKHMPFKRVYDTKKCYIGPCSNSPLTASLSGVEADSELIMPVIMKEDVVSFIYVCGNSEKLKEMLLEYDNIASKASLTFEMLIIKNKILVT